MSRSSILILVALPACLAGCDDPPPPPVEEPEPPPVQIAGDPPPRRPTLEEHRNLCGGGDETSCVEVMRSELALENTRLRACERMGCEDGRADELTATIRAGATRARALCREGIPSACGLYAHLLREAPVTDEESPAVWFGRGCEGDDPGSCYEVAQEARAAAQHELARARYGTACDAWHAPSCQLLAEMTQRGEGAPADPVRARELYQRACAAGDSISCDFAR